MEQAKLKKLCCVAAVFIAISSQLNAQQKELTYDLRSCDDGFSIIWDYYSSLASELKNTQHQLRNDSRAIGRFSERAVIPNLSAIAEKLGANRQIFTTILWREMGQDRFFSFAVQRTLDVYGKIYYPFFVYEEYRTDSTDPKCEEQALLQSIPSSAKLSKLSSTKAPFALLSDPLLTLQAILPFASLRIKSLRIKSLPLHQFSSEVKLHLIAQKAENKTAKRTTVLLEVANAQQLCGWQQHYGKSVIVPAQQLSGSSGWRLRDQKDLPYGLTRLQLYLWGKPYPMAYTSYDGKNYVILASFENGYRLHYPVAENIQITGSVMFWLAPVAEIPDELPPTNEDLTKYDCIDQ